MNLPPSSYPCGRRHWTPKFCLSITAVLAICLFSLFKYDRIIMGYNTLSSSSSSSSSIEIPAHHHHHHLNFDEEFANEGRTYGICSHLDSLQRQNEYLVENTKIVYNPKTFNIVHSSRMTDVVNSSYHHLGGGPHRQSEIPSNDNTSDLVAATLNEYYEVLLANNQMNCGRKRVQLSMISKNILAKKKSNYAPWTSCVPQIAPAKRRLLGYLHELCEDQKYGNEIVASTKSKNVSIAAARYSSSSSSSSRSSSSSSSSSSRRPLRKKGVIYTGKAKHFRDIFQSIYAVRIILEMRSIEIEIWTNNRDMSTCQSVFEYYFNDMYKTQAGCSECASVLCKAFSSDVSGYVSKFYAMLYSSFTDAFYLDSDNVPAKDLDLIFESSEYKKTGMVLWPDFWGDRCRANLETSPYGDSAYETFVLYAAKFPGFAEKWRNERLFAQESEAGQIAIDLTRHRGLLNLGRKLMEDRLFFNRIFHGDKDVFRIVHILLDKPLHYVGIIPGFSTSITASLLNELNANALSESLSKKISSNPRDCITHYFDGATSSTPTTLKAINSGSSSSNHRALISNSDNYGNINNNSSQLLASSDRNSRKLYQLERNLRSNYFRNNNHSNSNSNSDSNGGLPSTPITSSDSSYPSFFHQFKLHKSDTFSNFWRLPSELTKSPSICLDLININQHPGNFNLNILFDSKEKGLLTSDLVALSGDVKLALDEFGKRLIDEVDSVWDDNFKNTIKLRILIDSVEDFLVNINPIAIFGCVGLIVMLVLLYMFGIFSDILYSMNKCLDEL